MNPYKIPGHSPSTKAERAMPEGRKRCSRCKNPGMGLESKENAPETQNAGRQAAKQKQRCHGLESS